MANSLRIQHLNFVFKRSRIAIALQALLLLFMSYCLYQTIHWLLWLCCVLFAVVSYLIYLKRPLVAQLEYLAEDDWSLKYTENNSVLSVKIDKVIDHQVYVLIHFQDKKQHSMLIWHDQVSKLQWKSLKTRAKLA